MNEALISYGGLGLLTLASVTAAIHVYRDKIRQDEAHRAEMKVMLDRYIQSMNTFQEKLTSFAEKVHDLTVRLEAKIDRR